MPARGFEVVVAADQDRGIARGGAIPWRLPGDMAHFKRLTTTVNDPARPGAVNAVIMGRATWDSLPARFRPLPGRRNLVLSRRADLPLPPDVLHATSLDQALAQAAADPAIARVFVIGGGQIYAEAVPLPACQRIHYTRVLGRFGCDVHFPAFEHAYVLDEVVAEAEENHTAYRIEVWQKDISFLPAMGQ